jgi:hypothetical protein
VIILFISLENLLGRLGAESGPYLLCASRISTIIFGGVSLRGNRPALLLKVSMAPSGDGGLKNLL